MPGATAHYNGELVHNDNEIAAIFVLETAICP
jgi:hypothetical protein